MKEKLELAISKLDHILEYGRATRVNQWVMGFGLAALIVAVVVLVGA